MQSNPATNPMDGQAATSGGYGNGFARQAKKLAVLAAGAAVTSAGVAMIVLPGPAFIVIPVGLTILGSEWKWLRHRLDDVKTWVHEKRAARASRKGS